MGDHPLILFYLFLIAVPRLSAVVVRWSWKVVVVLLIFVTAGVFFLSLLMLVLSFYWNFWNWEMMRYCCFTDFFFRNLRCSESQKRSRYVTIAACTAPRCKPTTLCIPAGKWPAAHTCVNLPGLGLCPLCMENREGGADNVHTHT